MDRAPSFRKTQAASARPTNDLPLVLFAACGEAKLKGSGTGSRLQGESVEDTGLRQSLLLLLVCDSAPHRSPQLLLLKLPRESLKSPEPSLFRKLSAPPPNSSRKV